MALVVFLLRETEFKVARLEKMRKGLERFSSEVVKSRDINCLKPKNTLDKYYVFTSKFFSLC